MPNPAPEFVAVADDVAALINAAAIGPDKGQLPVDEVEAVVTLRPIVDLKTFEGWAVFVVPRGVVRELVTRADTQRDFRIEIGVFKRLTETANNGGVPDLDELAEALLEVQRICELFEVNEPLSPSNAQWIETVNDPAIAQEQLDNNDTFSSLIALTFRLI